MDEMALRTLEKLAEALRQAQDAYEAACLDADRAECALELAREHVVTTNKRRYEAQKALSAAAGLRDATWG